MNAKVSLVTSLIAWGSHFPGDTYLNLVSAFLEPGGHSIIDIPQEYRWDQSTTAMIWKKFVR